MKVVLTQRMDIYIGIGGNVPARTGNRRKQATIRTKNGGCLRPQDESGAIRSERYLDSKDHP